LRKSEQTASTKQKSLFYLKVASNGAKTEIPSKTFRRSHRHEVVTSSNFTCKTESELRNKSTTRLGY